MPSRRNEGPLAVLSPASTATTATTEAISVKSQNSHQISPPTTPTKKIKSVNGSTSETSEEHMVLTSTSAIITTTAPIPTTNNGTNYSQQNGKIIGGGGGISYNNGSSKVQNGIVVNRHENGYNSYQQLLESNQILLNDDEDSENEYNDENALLSVSFEDAYRPSLTTSTAAQKSSTAPSPTIPKPTQNNNFDSFSFASYPVSPPVVTKSVAISTPVATKSVVAISTTTTTTTKNNYNNTVETFYEAEMPRPKKVYKVVLTGGPCGGKTTGQARLCTFFENLGWKVFRVPESATVLLSGGIKFSELTEAQAFRFQEDLVKTMMHIESVFFSLAETVDKDVLIICDRGTMDASAFIPREQWEDILKRNGWNEVDIRDTRYNHIIHMVSAANGAEPFYTVEDHTCRTEGLELACKLDQKAAQAWVGHPYFDVVDNSTDFETKVCRMIQCICQKLGIDARDRLQTNSRKVKYLVKAPLPSNDMFPVGFQDFLVVHDYLQTTVPHPKMQARLRKRGQNGNWSYTYTVRRPELQGQVIEVKTALTQRDYNNMLTQKDHNHVTIYKTRRCFLLNDQYFQLDIYDDPCHPRCKGLVMLETYSTLNGIELQQRLPECLTIIKEVTGDPRYSMFNLSLKDKWENNKNFCSSLAGSDHQENRTPFNN